MGIEFALILTEEKRIMLEDVYKSVTGRDVYVKIEDGIFLFGNGYSITPKIMTEQVETIFETYEAERIFFIVEAEYTIPGGYHEPDDYDVEEIGDAYDLYSAVGLIIKSEIDLQITNIAESDAERNID